MAEGYQPYLVTNFVSKKTVNENDTISFDDLRQYGNGIFSIKTPPNTQVPSGTFEYWFVIQIAFYTDNAYVVQIAMSSDANYKIYMRKYRKADGGWNAWKHIEFS